MKEPLRCFTPSLPFSVQYRNLPHWDQPGVCAFVTMRLGDSIPRSVHTSYKELKRKMCKMYGVDEGLNGQAFLHALGESKSKRFQRLANRHYQTALDRGVGSCVFRNREVRTLLIDVLEQGAARHFTMGTGVIMPNHIHLLLQPKNGHSLGKVLSGIRRVSARRINGHLGWKGELWQPEPFDHLIRSRWRYEKFAQYICLNPVRAKLRPDEYSCWDGDL